MKKYRAARFLTAAALLASLLAAGGLVGLARAAGDEQPATTTSVFRVEGMTCGGCEVAVEMKVGRLDGVERVEASHRKGRAEVTYDPGKVTPERIVAAIEELGYAAALVEQEVEETAAAPSPLAGPLARR
jgi:copper ion binding protein